MKLKLTATALAACLVFGGTAFADPPRDRNRASTSAAGGVAVATPDGAGAGGVAASRADQRRDRRDRRSMNRMRDACVPGSAATSTSGAVHTNRHTGSAAINTNGTAAGSGSVSSSSEGEVYSSTDHTGSQADAYGNSAAAAREPVRPC